MASAEDSMQNKSIRINMAALEIYSRSVSGSDTEIASGSRNTLDTQC